MIAVAVKSRIAAQSRRLPVWTEDPARRGRTGVAWRDASLVPSRISGKGRLPRLQESATSHSSWQLWPHVLFVVGGQGAMSGVLAWFATPDATGTPSPWRHPSIPPIPG